MSESNTQNDKSQGTADAVAVIAAYKDAKKKSSTASFTVAGIILGILTLNALYLIIATKNFFGSGLPAFWETFGKGMAVVTQRHYPQAQQLVRNVTPAYINAFENMASKEFGPLKAKLDAELQGIEDYAESRKPDIERELDKIANKQLTEFTRRYEAAAGRKLSHAELQNLARVLRETVGRKWHEAWWGAYLKHEKVAKRLEWNLNRLARSEPDLNRDVSAEEAIGILVEFFGVELQETDW